MYSIVLAAIAAQELESKPVVSNENVASKSSKATESSPADTEKIKIKPDSLDKTSPANEKVKVRQNMFNSIM